MVKEVKRENQTLYVCEECGFAYEKKVWAQKCEHWCRKHQSCNLEITRHGFPLEEKG